jgi:hypothetical protein
MSRWVLVFLVFTFFIFAPTVVFVCGNVLDTMSGGETCLAQVLANKELVERPLPTVQMNLPVGLLMVAGVIWLAAATQAPALLPSSFTLQPIKPPPR